MPEVSTIDEVVNKLKFVYLFAQFIIVWFFSLFLSPAPRSALGRVVFFTISCFYATLHSFIAWVFSPFPAPTPRHTLSPRGLFRHFLLLHPRHTLSPRGFFAISCSYTPPQSVITWLFSHFPPPTPQIYKNL